MTWVPSKYITVTVWRVWRYDGELESARQDGFAIRDFDPDRLSKSYELRGA
jgi:hypothetical protein